MKTTVFGGSGFLGSHVCDKLSDAGHEVTIFDLKPSPWIRPEQKMIVGDILDKALVDKAVKGVDVVFNFAGIADIDEANDCPLDTIRYNILGNSIILEVCQQADIKRFVYASTIYVYSNKGGFYRCSKQAAEIYIEEFSRKYGIDFTILRYGTLYGPRANEKNSIYRYLKQAMETGCVVCSGSAEAMREYIDVRDAARLSAEAMDNEYRNRHIVISGPYPMKFKDMIFMIGEIIEKNINIEFAGIKNPDHYSYTPYSFTPKVGHKIISHCYVDMGQGLLECLHEMYGRKIE